MTKDEWLGLGGIGLLVLACVIGFVLVVLVYAGLIGAVIGAMIGVPVWIVMTIVGMF